MGNLDPARNLPVLFETIGSDGTRVEVLGSSSPGAAGGDLARGDLARSLSADVRNVEEGAGGLLRVVQDDQQNRVVNGSCFVAGTLIATPDGLVPIENIQVGDKVYSGTEEWPGGAFEVRTLYRRQVDCVYDIKVDGETIMASSEHPFWVMGYGWKLARELASGDLLLTRDGLNLPVDDIQCRDGDFQVYSFEVSEYHTYYVSKLEIYVHNNCNPIIAGLPANNPNILATNLDQRAVDNLFSLSGTDDLSRELGVLDFFESFRRNNVNSQGGSNFTSRGQRNRNFALIDFDIDGMQGNFVIGSGGSGIPFESRTRKSGAIIPGRVLQDGASSRLSDGRLQFLTDAIVDGELADGINRAVDAERLGLEFIARSLDGNSSGRIRIASELLVCDGCQAAIANFRRLFPGITIEAPISTRQRTTFDLFSLGHILRSLLRLLKQYP